jgi:hypothetical protein
MNPTGVGGSSKGQSGNPGGRRKKTAEDINPAARPPLLGALQLVHAAGQISYLLI